RAGHVDGAAPAPSFDSPRTAITILVKIVLSRPRAEKVPRVGEAGVSDLLGAERLGAVAGKFPVCARGTHATAEQSSDQEQNGGFVSAHSSLPGSDRRRFQATVGTGTLPVLSRAEP